MIFALDTEVTTINTGDPFDIRNSFVVGGYGSDGTCHFFTEKDAPEISKLLRDASLVILFNGKFDLHWLRRIGVDVPIRLPIWDCQLAEFVLANQRMPYPSLDDSCIRRGLGSKIDVIKEKYWNNGIDTNDIPREELDAYLAQDVSLTYKLYQAQLAEFQKPEHQSKINVFKLGCYDLLVLEEMEWNGYKFDVQAALEKANAIEAECTRIDAELFNMFPDVTINFGSNDHVSAILYGGSITNTIKLPIGTYKSGKKVGEIRYQNHDQVFEFPRLVEPLKGSALAKEGYFSTNEDTLNSLNAKGQAKKIISLLLERRGLEKLRGTYYEGVPKLINEHHWQQQLVHGNLNQCVAKSGRLSATKPNQQNMPSDCKKLCVSRY